MVFGKSVCAVVISAVLAVKITFIDSIGNAVVDSKAVENGRASTTNSEDLRISNTISCQCLAPETAFLRAKGDVGSIARLSGMPRSSSGSKSLYFII